VADIQPRIEDSIADKLMGKKEKKSDFLEKAKTPDHSKVKQGHNLRIKGGGQKIRRKV